MKIHLLLLLCLLAALTALTGCDTKTSPTEPDQISMLLSMEVSADQLPADGLSEITITATLTSEDPDPNRLTVQFETTGGTLLQGTAVESCETSGAVSCIQVEADRATLVATAQLRSSTTEGPVTVAAILVAVGTRVSQTVAFVSGEQVLSFRGTPAHGEADGETAIEVIVTADARLAPGTIIKIEASNGVFVSGSPTVELPLALDHKVVAQLRSRAEPGTALLTASVPSETLAPARYEITFGVALPSTIQVESASTVEVNGAVDLGAEYFRSPGAGSVTEGLSPLWSADKIDGDGNVVELDVGRLFDVTIIQKDAANPDRRKSTAKFEATGLDADDNVRITVRVDGSSASGQTILAIEDP